LKSPEAIENQLRERLQALTEERIESSHPDKGSNQPFPVPLVIIGGKYDLFQVQRLKTFLSPSLKL
jgi:hypothetical protein